MGLDLAVRPSPSAVVSGASGIAGVHTCVWLPVFSSLGENRRDGCRIFKYLLQIIRTYIFKGKKIDFHECLRQFENKK